MSLWVTVSFFCVPCRITPWSGKPIADANVMASPALTMCRLPTTGEVLTPHEEPEFGGEGAFGGEAEGGSGDLHAESGFRTGSVARAEGSGDVAGERSELVGVEALRRGDCRAKGVLERVVGEQCFAVHRGEGNRASGVGRAGKSH